MQKRRVSRRCLCDARRFSSLTQLLSRSGCLFLGRVSRFAHVRGSVDGSDGCPVDLLFRRELHGCFRRGEDILFPLPIFAPLDKPESHVFLVLFVRGFPLDTRNGIILFLGFELRFQRRVFVEPWHCRHDCGLRVYAGRFGCCGRQDVVEVVGTSEEGLHAEVYLSCRVRGESAPFDLIFDFFGAIGFSVALRLVGDSSGIESGPDGSLAGLGGFAAPPLQESHKACVRVRDVPVELRREVVDPSLAEPQSRVGVEFFVLVESFDLFGVSGSPHTERAYADFDPRFDFLGVSVEALDELVDVVSAPVAAVELATHILILLIGFLVREIDDFVRLFILNLIGVEIVVDVDSVNVVSFDDIENDCERVFLRFLFSGIHPEILAISFDDIGFGFRDVVVADLFLVGVEQCSVWVEPCVQLHASFVRFGDGHFQRVIERLGRFAHLSGEERRPRFEVAFVHCVRRRSDVEENGIHVEFLALVHDVDEFFLLLLRAQASFAWPVDVRDGCYPHATKLAHWLGQWVLIDIRHGVRFCFIGFV